MKAVILNTQYSDKPDQDGDIFAPGAFKLPKEVVLTKNFDISHPIGKAEAFDDDGVLKVKIPDGTEQDNVDYNIGFMIKKFKVDGDIRIIQEAELYEVSLTPKT